jgi:hypothetical protein
MESVMAALYLRPLPPLVLAALAFALAPAARADDQPLRAGIEISAQPSMAEVGLPSYPGARMQPEAGDSAAGVKFGIWGGAFGLKLQVLKFVSDDSADQVAAYYAKALAGYGAVLDCRDPALRRDKTWPDDEKLHCDGNPPAPGAYLYKVGTARDFRLVAVQPRERGAAFSVVRLGIKK